MLDIKKIRDKHAADVELLDPVSGAPLDAIVTLIGPEHPKRKKIHNDRMRQVREAFSKAGKIEVTDPEDDEAQSIADLAACTIGWRGIVSDGVAIDYTPEAAAALYADPELGWLRDQVRAFLNRRDVFIESSGNA